MNLSISAYSLNTKFVYSNGAAKCKQSMAYGYNLTQCNCTVNALKGLNECGLAVSGTAGYIYPYFELISYVF